MAHKDWVEFNEIELINMARTVALCESMDIEPVWASPESTQWIKDALGGSGYNSVLNAPWYDSGFPASSEFAGIVPLSLAGLDDSTLTSTPIEYITDGGHSGKPRNATLSIVANVAIVGRTERGVEYGKRWLDRVLRGDGPRLFCSGVDMRYFRYADADAPLAHRRNVRVTRGTSVTRKRKDDCSVTWLVTFTLTAADPYEYGEPVPHITALNAVEAVGPAVSVNGEIALTQETCPQFDYTPITDPLHPALVESPTAPDFYPDGWDLVEGQTFQRFWARLTPMEPSPLLVVPTLVLTSVEEARMVRVSIWPASEAESVQCDPLFTVTLTYIPPASELTIDGERQAVYVWDGLSEGVRRAETLAYDLDAGPLKWAAFNDAAGLLVVLDVLVDGSSDDNLSGGDVSVALSLTHKSD